MFTWFKYSNPVVTAICKAKRLVQFQVHHRLLMTEIIEQRSSSSSAVVPTPNLEEEEEDHSLLPQLETKEERRRRRKEKQTLLEQLPKHDANGRAYNKGELRRMLKQRISKGLDTIEKALEEEEHGNHNHDEQRMKETNHNNDDDDDDEPNKHTDSKQRQLPVSEISQANPIKRIRCHKPVPEDYTCAACQNAVSPRHWIYDCPNKQKKHMTSSTKKNKNDDSATGSDKKVFVSGLPFDATHRYVVSLLEEQASVRIVHCKILKFEDSKRCKGQAYVTLESAADAQRVREKLDGWTIHQHPQDTTTTREDEIGKDKQTDSTKDHPSNKKVLRLKVSKVLNRNVTKKKQQQQQRRNKSVFLQDI